MSGGGLPPRKSGRSVRSLGKDIEEIDALLAASQRARQSVSERASKLMQEHDIIQRNFKFELERETLQQKPRGRLRPKKTTRGGSGADHALLFHLAEPSGGDEDAAGAEDAPAAKKAAVKLEPPPDAIIPAAPSYASRTEAREWDEYYRFCARGALFKALDQGRATEAEICEGLSVKLIIT